MPQAVDLAVITGWLHAPYSIMHKIKLVLAEHSVQLDTYEYVYATPHTCKGYIRYARVFGWPCMHSECTHRQKINNSSPRFVALLSRSKYTGPETTRAL